ncbi:hypothetical protein HPP92_011382 [Vanilla planifolia]|uniref:SHSP domain-containing protein n=1 Tax=Vanilla planifolia TaxID=51239 RepID=A0A835R442_VANPL|nr:hypothetical protein HPP92_011382 [Vanilla planifolia]
MSATSLIHPVTIFTAPNVRRPRPLILRTIRAARSDSLDHLQRSRKQTAQPPPSSAQLNRRRVEPWGLWDQFPAARTVQQMIDTMERIIEDPFISEREAASAASGGFNGYRRGGRTPWEIRELTGEYKMRFDMPGMTKSDVKVWVEEGVLVIKAEKQQQQEAEEEWPARGFGRYSSRISLPEKAVVEKIQAEVRDGVLYVTIPKASPSSKAFDVQVQ